jgi:peroxiredoxin
MGINNEMNVNAQLDLLTPEPEWQPDLNGALARFERQRLRTLRTGWRTVIAASLVVACVCLAAVMEFRGVSAADRVLKDRQPAPDFALPDANGATIKLSSYKHKVVLLNFWATWCGGCKVEIPWFIEFENKYRDRGFQVVGVSMDDDGFRSVKPFSLEHKLSYPVVIGNERLAKLYGVESMPETVLIDRSGRIAAFHLGLVDQSALEREIRTLLD